MSNIMNVLVVSSPLGRCSPGFINAFNSFLGYLKKTFPDGNISVEGIELDGDFDYVDPKTYDWEQYLIRFTGRINFKGDYLIVDADNFPNIAGLLDKKILPEARSRFYAVRLLKSQDETK